MNVLDVGLQQLIDVARREGVILADQVSDVEIMRLDEHGNLSTVIVTINPDLALA